MATGKWFFSWSLLLYKRLLLSSFCFWAMSTLPIFSNIVLQEKVMVNPASKKIKYHFQTSIYKLGRQIRKHWLILFLCKDIPNTTLQKTTWKSILGYNLQSIKKEVTFLKKKKKKKVYSLGEWSSYSLHEGKPMERSNLCLPQKRF